MINKSEKTNGPGHAKTCLMPYANNKGADQPINESSNANNTDADHAALRAVVVFPLPRYICMQYLKFQDR